MLETRLFSKFFGNDISKPPRYSPSNGFAAGLRNAKYLKHLEIKVRASSIERNANTPLDGEDLCNALAGLSLEKVNVFVLGAFNTRDYVTALIKSQTATDVSFEESAKVDFQEIEKLLINLKTLKILNIRCMG